MHTERVCDHRFDVEYRHGWPATARRGRADRPAAGRLRRPPASASLHLRQTHRRETPPRWGSLDYPPQRLVDQVTDFSASPFAVVDFGEPVIDSGSSTAPRPVVRRHTAKYWRRRDRLDRRSPIRSINPGIPARAPFVEVDRPVSTPAVFEVERRAVKMTVMSRLPSR